MRISQAFLASTLLLLGLLLGLVVPAYSQAKGDGGGGGPYDPPGTLYDNGQDNGSGQSQASQDSVGNFTERTADDFILDGAGCASGRFEITRIRAQLLQWRTTPQAFAVELYADDGSDIAPTPGISPFTSFPEASQTLIGPSGNLDRYEASFDTPGLVLQSGVRYWLSAFGIGAALNADSSRNFFLPSNGATGTVANGVYIAPDLGTPDWISVADTGLGTPEHFSFAIDGACLATPTAVPTLTPASLAALATLLALAGLLLLGRRAA